MTTFFDIQREQSRVKAEIVSEYFKAWSAVMVSNVKRFGKKFNTDQIVYLDLYSGPGAYGDGRDSTPLLILRHALASEDLKRLLFCVFNDSDADNIQALQQNIQHLGVDQMAYPPKLFVNEVDKTIVQQFELSALPPTFLFADPFGYKGLTLDLINAILKDFGSECIFFFNYNRMQAAITNPKVRTHVDALFGNKRADRLRLEVAEAANKEQLIMQSLHQGLVEKYGRYYCDFRFPDEDRNCTSHYLVYVTKNRLGYELMKPIMAKASSIRDRNGIYNFQYDPRDSEQLSLFNPLDELATRIHADFQGKQLKLDDFYYEHSVGTDFIRPNYVEAVWKLYERQQISFSEVPKRREHCGSKTVISFLKTEPC